MTQKPWQAQHRVGLPLARKLIREQTNLEIRSLTLLGEGWDNVVYLVDKTWAFRFPRRPLGVQLLKTECAVLPKLVDKLNMPIPWPEYLVQPSPAFPYPFAGYRYLPGKPACDPEIRMEQRIAMGAAIGHFLQALHQIPREDFGAINLPGDELDRLNTKNRRPVIEERLHQLAAWGYLAAAADWQPLLNVPHPAARPACLVHGDFYACHLLVDTHHQPCGVIDWGDVHWGDPALDLIIARSFLPAEGAAAFRTAYGTIDAQTWQLAGFRALASTTAIAVYAHDKGNKAMLTEALNALQRLQDGC